MTTVLVTGGNGSLGREVVVRLVAAGQNVRVLSRRLPDTPREGVVYIAGDIRTGTNVPQAVRGADAVIHCATSAARDTRATDVTGTQMLLVAAEAAGVAHFLYPSIVGVEAIPYAYYKAKHAAQKIIADANVPWTILQATQFHTFIHGILGALARAPVLLVPKGFPFQTIAHGEVADTLVALVTEGPQRQIVRIGGPKVRRIEDLATEYIAHTGSSRRVVPIPLPGRIAAGFRAGANTCADRAEGVQTWEQYLAALPAGAR